jgi:hypothetical protein
VPDLQTERPLFCSRCGRPVVVEGASFCKECGAQLTNELPPIPADSHRKAVIAAALSIVPGLGHLYRGHPWRALWWFLGVSFAYTMQPLGFVLHLVCAANAALDRRIGHRRFAPDSRADGSRAWSGP